MQAADSDRQHYDEPRPPAAGHDRDLEIAENTTVNRPFSAFAALMTLLALAMFAVSSTSRSTAVQAARRVQGSGFRVQKGTGNRRQGTGVSSKQFVRMGREKSFVTATTAVALKPLSTGYKNRRAAMLPARIVVAENTLARVRTASPVDCRSHYDSAYDLIVYGIRDNAVEMPQGATEVQAALPANLAGELDRIFQELASRQSVQPLPQAGAMNIDRKTLRWKALAAAVAGWMKYHARQALESQAAEETTWQTGMSAPLVGWAEYAEFADRVAARNVANAEAAEALDGMADVRSGDWLRHSAAASLHQLSLILKSAAEELERAGRPVLSVMAK